MLDHAAIQIRAAEAAAIACVKFAFHRRGTRSLYRSSEPQKLHRGKKQERQSCLSKISIALYSRNYLYRCEERYCIAACPLLTLRPLSLWSTPGR